MTDIIPAGISDFMKVINHDESHEILREREREMGTTGVQVGNLN